MSYDVVNGKVVKVAPNVSVKAPSPSQIAERAYELACKVACEAILLHDGDVVVLLDAVKEVLDERKAEILAALRESVVNPGVIPWWKK